jgi:hypothetical protein
LIPLSPEDQLKKVAYQAELEFEEMRVHVVEAPFARITSICKAFSDCPPVSNAATVFKGARDYLLGDVDARKNQIANYIEQLNDERLKIERIDNWIDALNSFKDALDACGDL